MDEVIAGVNDAVSNYVSATDLIEVAGVPIEEHDPDVRMWKMLSAVARACGNPHPALRSLLWYEVMTICEQRFNLFQPTADGRLIRK